MKNKIISISFPWVLAQLLSHHPVLSYFIAYGGSLFIFYYTILSPAKCIDLNKALHQQVMRPIVLIQLVFAGFMCCTSLFYFADHLGFVYLENVSHDTFSINEHTFLLAACQRLALLGHMGLVIGIVSQAKHETTSQYEINIPLNRLLYSVSAVAMIISAILSRLPLLFQFSVYLSALVASVNALLFIRGLAQRKILPILYGGILLSIQMADATLSGYKETLFISLILISFIAFPYFKKMVAILFLPCLLILIYVLPTFTSVIRTQSWRGGKSASLARAEAYDTLSDQGNELIIVTNNWEFLTRRLTEIAMFAKYIDYVPNHQPYYGLQILKNAVTAVIPRGLWKGKPDTEQTAMERVYEAGVINRKSAASAKTRPVIDGYLSAGLTGVFFSMLLYGRIAQWLSNKAELWFGGYELGCVIVFNSLFQQLWRGNNWEFIINNMVYGYLLMTALFVVFRYFKVLNLKTV